MHHVVLIHSSVDAHLGCFHDQAIVKCCNEHWGASVFELCFSPDMCLGLRLLGHMVTLFLVL